VSVFQQFSPSKGKKWKTCERMAAILLYYTQQKYYLNKSYVFSQDLHTSLEDSKVSGASEAHASRVRSSTIFVCTNCKEIKVAAAPFNDMTSVTSVVKIG
jgi:hypothetical protein